MQEKDMGHISCPYVRSGVKYKNKIKGTKIADNYLNPDSRNF